MSAGDRVRGVLASLVADGAPPEAVKQTRHIARLHAERRNIVVARSR
jgi:hypothetical protein